MKNKIRKRIRKDSAAPIALLAVGFIFVYAFFAYPCYTRIKVSAMKRIFQEISDMDFSPLDGEDEEILQGYYQDDRFEITVTDDELKLVYTNHSQSPARDIEKYILDHQDEYHEPPTIHIRKNKVHRVIRLRGLVTQKDSFSSDDSDASAVYYVYIRKEIRSMGEMIQYTVIYFGTAFLILAGIWYFLRKKNAEDSQRNQDISAENLVRMQKDFMANISHELKTPLAVISGQVEMLQSMGDGIDRDYYFSSIREEIDKMSDLVGNLLEITNIEHHMEEMEIKDVNLSDMMEYMILKYDALFHQNKLRFRAELADDCIVRANQMYLEQAINNYIMNAFQHTAQGCEIGIRLAREQKYAVLYVYNEGGRVDPQNMERIWQGFYMGPGDRSRMKPRKMANAGLGLYLVKKIVEQHKGSCGVENKEKGVEFWMKIPLA